MNARWMCLWACLLVLAASVASAQEPVSGSVNAPPPHLSILEGSVVVDREGVSEPAAVNAPLLDGDRIRTGDGRAEVLFPDGSALHLDRETTVDLLAQDLLRLMQGRIVLQVVGDRDPTAASRYQIDAPPASVQTGGPGEYRLDLDTGSSGQELWVTIVSGVATLATDNGSVTARAGERVRGVAGLRPIGPEYYNSARLDEFDRWSVARRDERRGVVSVAYLPQEVQPYAATFDRYGTWRQEPDYGYVWYPAVATDWRPYWSGYWRPYSDWGSFWISADPWGWPTHHYGRWGFSLSFGWYWIPGRSWGAAWVHWAVAPGYVSWCPLGYYNRPVFGHWGVPGHVYGHPVDPWRGWTVMPRQHYGRAVPVSHVALDGRRLDHGARGTFVAQRAAPASQYARAVPRGTGGSAATRGAAASARIAPPAPRGGQAPGTSRVPAMGAALSPLDAASRTRSVDRGAGLGSFGSSRRALPGAPVPSESPAGGRVRQRGDAFPSGGVPAPALPGDTARRRVIPGPFRSGEDNRGGAAGAAPSQGAMPDRSDGRQRWPDAWSGTPRSTTPAARDRSFLPGSSGPTSAAPARPYQPGSPAYGTGGGDGRRYPSAAPRQAPPAGYQGGPAGATPSASPREPRGAPSGFSGGPRTSGPPSRGTAAPPSRYNPGTASPRGAAAPRGGQNRRAPDREP